MAVETLLTNVILLVAKELVDYLSAKYQSRRVNGDLVQK